VNPELNGLGFYFI